MATTETISAARLPMNSRAPEQGNRLIWVAGGIIALAVTAAYHNSFSVPFVFDDPSSITNNPTIRHLWPPWAALSPPHAAITVQGRPILNFSLAVNYAFGGDAVFGYHVLNAAIHVIAALALFGLVRRTLASPRLRPRFGAAASGIAFNAAVLWAVHPLQTEAITYVIQRAESLMGMFYLLTLYGLVRGAESAAPARWFALAIAACTLGMGTKEVMVSAPLVALLYDRTFLAGSFAAAWRQRRHFYWALAATWLILAWSVFSTGGNRGGSAGFDVGVRWWDYWETQFPVLVHYLRLAGWPHPLVFEYGTFWIQDFLRIVPQIVIVVALIAATLVALRRNAALGFPAVLCCAVLAVTSLVPGTTQMIVEHRMYLPLAAFTTGFALAAHAVAGRRALAAVAAAAVALAWLTSSRNDAYRGELDLWADTIVKRPGNALARLMYAQALDRAGRHAEAIPHFATAVKIHPGFAIAHDGLGQDLLRQGRVAEAIEHFETAVRLDAQFADAHDNLGAALARSGRPQEAAVHFAEALRLNPELTEAHYNFGNLLAETGQPADAIGHYEQALRGQPAYFEAHYNLANALAGIGRQQDAATHYAEAVRIRPEHSRAHYNFGNTLVRLSRLADALAEYERAVQLAPDFVDAQFNLGTALLQCGRTAEAIAHYEEALRLEPQSAEIREQLARVRASLRN